MVYRIAADLPSYEFGKLVMGDDLTLRLPPPLLVKLDRCAAHLEMSRSTYIASILRRTLEDGRPVILKADENEPSSDEFSAAGASDTAMSKSHRTP